MDTHTHKSTSTALPHPPQKPIKRRQAPTTPDNSPSAIITTTKAETETENENENETETKAAAEELDDITINSTNNAVHMQAQDENPVVKKDGALKAWISDKVENVLLAGPGWMKIG